VGWFWNQNKLALDKSNIFRRAYILKYVQRVDFHIKFIISDYVTSLLGNDDAFFYLEVFVTKWLNSGKITWYSFLLWILLSQVYKYFEIKYIPIIPIMDYMGKLCLKGVPFWAPGMGKEYLFQAGGMWKGYIIRERYEKGCRFSMWKGPNFPKFSMWKGKRPGHRSEHPRMKLVRIPPPGKTREKVYILPLVSLISCSLCLI